MAIRVDVRAMSQRQVVWNVVLRNCPTTSRIVLGTCRGHVTRVMGANSRYTLWHRDWCATAGNPRRLLVPEPAGCSGSRSLSCRC